MLTGRINMENLTKKAVMIFRIIFIYVLLVYNNYYKSLI